MVEVRPRGVSWRIEMEWGGAGPAGVSSRLPVFPALSSLGNVLVAHSRAYRPSSRHPAARDARQLGARVP